MATSPALSLCADVSRSCAALAAGSSDRGKQTRLVHSLEKRQKHKERLVGVCISDREQLPQARDERILEDQNAADWGTRVS